MRKRGNSLILIWGGLAFIFVLGISYFFLQNQQFQDKPIPLTGEPEKNLDQPVDTSNWKTYTDPQHKYTFLYPPSITPEIFGTQVNINFAPPDPRQIVGLCPPWISFKNYDPAENYQRFPSVTATVFSDRTAEYSEITDTYKCVHKIISIPKYPNKTTTPELIIEIQYRDSDTATANITNQILTTFKFTNGPTPQNSNPSVISDADNGKSFSYSQTSRFSVQLDKSKYPVANLNCKPDGVIGYISNLSLKGPDNYSVGYEAVKPGSCILGNGTFFVTINVTE